ncbi:MULTISPECIES: D-2-hydroxyacid dehydrogenase [Kosmotoga]|jgi:D-3-phosphoglycerate dehydrogenase|uniref:D-isomer specific 2-hydroxyacid dehydrogenase NAD-binding n=1 Tax=Kosmotoga olearia (strain ATCC BAA-1733 / DSM 21960 / TBF 19.5.1) TaxID=521045 RepID=C5CIR3_KOSOT|nr:MULTISPECIES: D-2-hydroxyacid dehydrogenase [Kosmotoga]ACR80846.1 D-isomer specific 2-hydroxyacid dehydrogenase NAD-binding [Kosmotoga olearia TBF 19.5.1]MDI3524156.1 hydroxypyruvate reductase [Kosmotoga sp.]MDK2952670.1 hydroxypyruvate reductase [Kosmotoga sp.]OAA25523.1 3-phosphoglycerate dehydrogenase [Kosmotoga sp. DU53]
MFRLHANDPLAPKAMNMLEESGLFEVTQEHLDKEELLKIIPDIEFLVVRSATKVTADILKAGTKLKVVGRAGVGLDNVDVSTAKELGIRVYNTPGANAISAAELTIGLLIALMRQIPRGTNGLKEGKWEKKKLKGHEIYGKTLGLIGFGAIGREVAKRALAFGMHVVAFDPYVENTDLDVELTKSVDDVLAKADVVSLHVPLTPRTLHILGEKEIEKMKDGAVIINAARGGVLDEQALYDALIAGKLAGAALDVFEVEPPVDELRRKLLGLPNVVATPHIGASTYEGQERVGIEMAKKLIEVAKEIE